MNLAQLARLGITARLTSEDEILLSAPTGVLTSGLINVVRQAKPELIKELERFSGHVNVVNIPPCCLNAGEGIATKATVPEAGLANTATASRREPPPYADSDPVKIACFPNSAQVEVPERQLDAVEAETFATADQSRSAPMTAQEVQAIRAWLALIEETDPGVIAHVLHQCQHDSDAREYFTGLASPVVVEEHRGNAALNDDRRTCAQWANLAARRCLAEKHGEIVANRNYEPIRDLPRRCDGYAPGPDDPDQRHGRERSPELIQEGGK